MKAALTFFLAGAVLLTAVTTAYCGNAETLTRTFSSNKAQIQRFMDEYKTTRDTRKRSQLLQKITVLSQADEDILKRLTTEAPADSGAARGSVGEPDPQAVLGVDWLEMTPADRESFVYASIGALQQRGVLLMKPSAHYVSALNQAVVLDESWERKPLANLFLYTVFSEEPQARAALKSLSS